jgi:uncharacterized protein YukE
MAGTEVLTGTLTEAATSVEELIGRYRQSVSKMYAIGAEIDSMWEGTASKTFATRLGSDRERFDAMAKLLEGYVVVLRNAASEYVRGENEVLHILNTNRR